MSRKCRYYVNYISLGLPALRITEIFYWRKRCLLRKRTKERLLLEARGSGKDTWNFWRIKWRRGDTHTVNYCVTLWSCDRILSWQLIKPVWICATDRSDKILSQRPKFHRVTRIELLERLVAATCLGLLRAVSRFPSWRFSGYLLLVLFCRANLRMIEQQQN